MGDKSAIEWTDATWNPVHGCSKVSPGCANCYAETLSLRRGFTRHPWTGLNRDLNVSLHPDRLDHPLRWRRPRRVFVNSMSDLFHESVPDDYIDAVFGVMALARWHTFQVLTKRASRLRAWSARGVTLAHCIAEADVQVEGGIIARHWRQFDGGISWPLPNVWLGVSVEDQRRALERIPALMGTLAAVRFLSCEPLLGPVDLRPWLCPAGQSCNKAPWLYRHVCPDNPLNWIIVGGESGAKARPMALEWARHLVLQAKAAGVPVFVKQLGRFPVLDPFDADPTGSGVLTPRDRKGGDPAEWPEDLRVREFPS